MNQEALRRALKQQLEDDVLYRMLTEERPHLFADSVVFVGESCMNKQREIIAAIESVIAMPAYQQRVLAMHPTRRRLFPKRTEFFSAMTFT